MTDLYTFTAGPMKMSTIQGVETKYNETYFLYDEVYFV